MYLPIMVLFIFVTLFMKKLIIPFIKSGKDNVVVWAEDTIIELHDNYFMVSIDAIEEVPRDGEDIALGLVEKKKQATAIVLRSAIMAIEWGYDDGLGCNDLTVFTTAGTWSYNCISKSKAVEYFTTIKDWWLQQGLSLSDQ